MRPIIKKTFLFGFLFIISPGLFLMPIGFLSGDYVSQNFAHQLDLSLLGYDLFWTVLGGTTLGVLEVIGIVLLSVASTAHIIEELTTNWFISENLKKS